MLLKQASGVQVGGTVDVVLDGVVVNVNGVIVELVVTGGDDVLELELLLVLVPELVVTGGDDVLELVVTGGGTQIVPPHVVVTIGEVTHALPVEPLTTEVVQVVILFVTAEQVVIGGAQLVVGGRLTQIEFAQVIVVIGDVAHMVDDPVLVQLVLTIMLVEHVVMGAVQVDGDDVVVLEVIGVVLEDMIVEVVAGGVTQMVLAQVVAVRGEVVHCDEAPLAVALQLIELPVVVTEQVVIGELQLKAGRLVLGGGVTQIVLAQTLVVTGVTAQDVELSLMVLQLVVLVVPVEQVVMEPAQLVTGVVALNVTGEVVVLVYGVEVREMVVLEVIVVDPSEQLEQGTVNVVNCVSVLHVEVTVVTPPTQVVHGTMIVVTNGAVGTGVVDEVMTMMIGDEVGITELAADCAATGVLAEELVRLIKGPVVAGVVAGTTVVTAAVVIVVFML